MATDTAPTVCEADDCTATPVTGFEELGQIRMVCRQHADLLADRRPVKFKPRR